MFFEPEKARRDPSGENSKSPMPPSNSKASFDSPPAAGTVQIWLRVSS
jgi:hypothetical protein